MQSIKFCFIVTLLFVFPNNVSAAGVHHARVCSVAKKGGLASCNAQVVVDAQGHPLFRSVPLGFSPQQLRSAYGVSGQANTPSVVAIVDAYDDPTIKKDLDMFSRKFGLSILPDCQGLPTNALPCFTKMNQRGKKALPVPNAGWAMEIALDVEAVHALCENCSILLVEADSPNTKNLLFAEDTAVAAGAQVISNSWGGPEFVGEVTLDSHFKQTGIAYVFSSGDSGYGVQYPAASQFVTAVDGTSLFMSGMSYKDENAWSGAGSGCSMFEPKPLWQKDGQCSGRTVADVSAVADPTTGTAVYSSTSPNGKKGWFMAGGTSLAAPIVAAIYAMAGDITGDIRANSAPYLRGSKKNLHDVSGGKNGDCSFNYLCEGVTKYDGPTGLGSPKGLGAF